MAIINSDYVLANAFITTKQEKLSKDELWDYYTIVDNKLRPLKKDDIDDFSVDRFLYRFDYAFELSDDDFYIILSNKFDKKHLDRYFRIGLPKYIIKLFDEAGKELKLRKCVNCCHGTYVLNELGENLYCNINEYAEYMDMVSPDDCCDNHIFMDDNFYKDHDDEIHKQKLKKLRKNSEK